MNMSQYTDSMQQNKTNKRHTHRSFLLENETARVHNNRDIGRTATQAVVLNDNGSFAHHVVLAEIVVVHLNAQLEVGDVVGESCRETNQHGEEKEYGCATFLTLAPSQMQ